MATVPAGTRSTISTLVSPSAGPFNIGFRLFEADGLKVYLNGVATTAFTVSADFSDGFDDAATITMSSAVAAGVELRIEGNMAPKRDGDYADGQPNLTYNMNIELARIAAKLSELQREVDRAVRGFAPVTPAYGIDLNAIANAEAYALAAAASAASAAAASNSLLRWRGAWVTATAYAPSDIVFQGGSSYVCVIAHTSGTFSTDLSASRWALFAQKGDAGAGTGDMLKTENLSGLANYGTARTNMGLGGAAVLAAPDDDNLANSPTAVALRKNVAANIKTVLVATVDRWASPGSDGGDFQSGAWRDRNMRRVRGNLLAGTELGTWNGTTFTSAPVDASTPHLRIQPGTYYVEAFGNAYRVQHHRLQLYNAGTSSTILYGGNHFSGDVASANDVARLAGYFTVGVVSYIGLRHQCTLTRLTDGFGPASNIGGAEEIYAGITLIKIA